MGSPIFLHRSLTPPQFASASAPQHVPASLHPLHPSALHRPAELLHRLQIHFQAAGFHVREQSLRLADLRSCYASYRRVSAQSIVSTRLNTCVLHMSVLIPAKFFSVLATSHR